MLTDVMLFTQRITSTMFRSSTSTEIGCSNRVGPLCGSIWLFLHNYGRASYRQSLRHRLISRTKSFPSTKREEGECDRTCAWGVEIESETPGLETGREENLLGLPQLGTLPHGGSCPNGRVAVFREPAISNWRLSKNWKALNLSNLGKERFLAPERP